MKLKKKDPSKYNKKANHIAKRTKRLDRLKNKSPEAYEIMVGMQARRHEIRTIVQSYKKSKQESERKALEQRLDSLLREQFNTRLELKKIRIAKLEKRIAHIKTKYEEQRENENNFLEKFKQRLLSGKAHKKKNK